MLAIDVENLFFQYTSTEGFLSFSLQLERFQIPLGERMVLFGPSGCGKSTLLNLIAGELVAQKGTVRVLSEDLSGLSEVQRRAFRIQNIGFVFQDFPLVDYLSAEENVLLPYRINPALQLKKGVHCRAKKLLVELGLEGKEHRQPRHLSQGEQQRVAIARALVVKPKIILADEPTAGLDQERSVAVMELLEKVVVDHEVTLVVVTHDPLVRSRFQHSLDMGSLVK